MELLQLKGRVRVGVRENLSEGRVQHWHRLPGGWWPSLQVCKERAAVALRDVVRGQRWWQGGAG